MKASSYIFSGASVLKTYTPFAQGYSPGQMPLVGWKAKVRSTGDYFFSSVAEAAAFFSYSSFTSQHFDLRNSLLRRPFFSAHLWASSSVFAFGQSSLQTATRLAAFSFAKAVARLKLSANPTVTTKSFIEAPFKKCCYEFDNLSYLHYYASMYQTKIEPTEAFQALADKTRIRILRIMVCLPRVEACLCEMTEALKESEPNVSRHFKVLRQAGLLAAEKDGRWVYHRLIPSELTQQFYRIVKTLPDTEGLFQQDLESFISEVKNRESERCRKKEPQRNSGSERKRAKS